MTFPQPQFRFTPDTRIVSDTHFWHEKFVKVGIRPEGAVDRILFENWRGSVEPDTDVLHLGDVGFDHPKHCEHPKPYYDAMIRELPGNKFLVRGNHDKSTVAQYAKRYGMQSWHGPRMGVVLLTTIHDTRYAFSHAPLADVANAHRWDVNIHGHIHTNGYPHAIKPLVESHRYHCVCVEYTNYAPVTLYSLLIYPTNTIEQVGYHPDMPEIEAYDKLNSTLVYIDVPYQAM